jgi:hypothetical protein
VERNAHRRGALVTLFCGPSRRPALNRTANQGELCATYPRHAGGR